MPVELSDLLGNERWVEVDIDGVVLRAAYRPAATSLRRQAELQKRRRQLQAQTDGDEVELTNEIGAIFCEMVSDWDLTSGGEPLPITPDVVTNALPGAIFGAIMQAIGEDAQSAQEEKKQQNVTSAAGLPARAKSASVLNGTSRSAPRSTWASPRGNS